MKSKIKDTLNDRSIHTDYIACDCHGHVLGIADYDDQLSIQWISIYNHSDSFWQKLRLAYQVFKEGSTCTNDILLGKEKVDYFVDRLIEARNRMEKSYTMFEEEKLEAKYKAVKEVEDYYNNLRKAAKK